MSIRQLFSELSFKICLGFSLVTLSTPTLAEDIWYSPSDAASSLSPLLPSSGQKYFVVCDPANGNVYKATEIVGNNVAPQETNPDLKRIVSGLEHPVTFETKTT